VPTVPLSGPGAQARAAAKFQPDGIAEQAVAPAVSPPASVADPAPPGVSLPLTRAAWPGLRWGPQPGPERKSTPLRHLQPTSGQALE
jgi:hypothetical protein